MAGRPRRRRTSSNSSAGTAEHAHVRWVKASSVLKPAPPDVPDAEWPCYVLNDAAIYRKDGTTLANPLLVHVEGPLVVRGLLEIDEDKLLSNLVRPSLRSAYIEIPFSDRYSIGDGPVVLWVSGAAGWFEIRPSPEYQPMYDQVREAINLYYSAFEVYEEYNQACQSRKKARRPSPPTLDQVFLRYAVRAGDGIVRHEVEVLYHKWAEFLLAHFGKEVDLDWENTVFAKTLRDAHPDIQKRAADAAKGIFPPQPPPPEPRSSSGKSEALQQRRSRSAKASSRNSEETAARDSRSPQPRPVARVKARISETPVPLPEKYRQFSLSTSSQTVPPPVESPRATPGDDSLPAVDADPVGRLLSALREIQGEVAVSNAPPSKIHSNLFFKCKIRHYSSAKDIVAYYAKDLVPRLDPEWKASSWYQWLKEVARQPWTPTGPTNEEDIPAQTFPRTKKTVHRADASTRPAGRLPPTIHLKATVKAEADESDGGSEEDLALPRTMRPRRSGKGASLRLVSGSKKRPHADAEDQAEEHRRGRKSAKGAHHYASIRDEPLEDAGETSDEDLVAADEDAGPAGTRLPLPEGAVRVVVHAEKLPSTSPTGPDGTWTCDQEGCTYVVRSADDQDAQELIQQHFRDHEAQAEKINLAVKESRGHMPINNLLNKLQEIGRAALLKSRTTVNGEPVPTPVKRRLLI